MSDKNVVKFKKRFHPNLALFLFLIIILYIMAVQNYLQNTKVC